jgi:hypothetical protein
VLGEHRVAPDVVVEVRVAAVDDRVARLEVLEQLLDLGLGGVAGGDHDPRGPRLGERATSAVDAVRRRDRVAAGLLLVGELVRLLDVRL